MRNIVSIRQSQDLFDDLSPDPHDQALGIRLEIESKPPLYTQSPALIGRPFEEAAYRDVIQYPFERLQPSRFSRGRFGVWYGALTLETTIFETAYHWYRFLCDTGDNETADVCQERRVHSVLCDSHLLDFTAISDQWPGMTANDYAFSQHVGDEMSRKKLPGLISLSARQQNGRTVAIFTPDVLSNPVDMCYLSYQIRGPVNQGVVVEREPGKVLLTVPMDRL